MKRTANNHCEKRKRASDLNRFLALFLSLLMVFSVFAVVPVSASSRVINTYYLTDECDGQFVFSGVTGTGVTWKYENKVLTFSGSGQIGNDLKWNDDFFIRLETDPNLEKYEDRYYFSIRQNTARIVINNGITAIPDNAFDGEAYGGKKWRELLEVSIPSSVTCIGKQAFRYNSNLNTLDLKAQLTKISEECFLGCMSLVEFTIPSGVKTIEAEAFRDCDSLKEIAIPEGVTSIGEGAFRYCNKLESVDFPSTLVEIGTHAFNGCGKHRYPNLQNTHVTTIDDYAFGYVTEITLPECIETIGKGAINGTIKGYSDTVAETYAQQYGLTFVPIFDSVAISFDPNGGSGYMESVQVKKNSWYTLPECGFAPPAGKEFRCWLAGTYVNPGSTINPGMDTVVKAVWKDADENKCTISFDPNGGNGTMYNVTVNKGSFYNAPECTFTAPEGRQFSHWTVNGERFDGGTIRENTVLKANWVGATVAYMDCSIPEPVVGERPSYVISVPNGAAYQQEWNYTGGLWGDGVAWEEVGGDAINYRSDYTFKPGRTYQVTISLVPVGGATFAQLSALRGYIDGKEAECFRYNASNVTLVRTFRTPESTILGDTDGDGEVEIRDATWIQRRVAAMDLPFTFNKPRSDVDGDGEITVIDATAIQRYLANMKTSYPIGKPV